MSDALERVLGLVGGLSQAKRAFPSAYDAGYNAGKVGSNPANSHFCWFSSRAEADEWDRGKRAAVSETGQ